VEDENSTSGPQPYQPYEAEVTNSPISNRNRNCEGGKFEGGGDSEVSTVRSEEGGFEHVDDVDSVGNRGDGNPHRAGRAGARFEFSRIPTDYEPGLAQAA